MDLTAAALRLEDVASNDCRVREGGTDAERHGVTLIGRVAWTAIAAIAFYMLQVRVFRFDPLSGPQWHVVFAALARGWQPDELDDIAFLISYPIAAGIAALLLIFSPGAALSQVSADALSVAARRGGPMLRRLGAVAAAIARCGAVAAGDLARRRRRTMADHTEPPSLESNPTASVPSNPIVASSASGTQPGAATSPPAETASPATSEASPAPDPGGATAPWEPDEPAGDGGTEQESAHRPDGGSDVDPGPRVSPGGEPEDRLAGGLRFPAPREPGEQAWPRADLRVAVAEWLEQRGWMTQMGVPLEGKEGTVTVDVIAIGAQYLLAIVFFGEAGRWRIEKATGPWTRLDPAPTAAAIEAGTASPVIDLMMANLLVRDALLGIADQTSSIEVVPVLYIDQAKLEDAEPIVELWTGQLGFTVVHGADAAVPEPGGPLEALGETPAAELEVATRIYQVLGLV